MTRLAQACVHLPRTEPLFPLGWPGAGTSASNSPLASAFSRLQSLKVSLPSSLYSKESFVDTIQRLDPSRSRHPRLGLSGFTIFSHILRDPTLGAGQANRQEDFPRLDAALMNRGHAIRAWCEAWIVDESGGWTEVVEKIEELFWMATVLVGASTRPGYKPRIDFFMMHGLTSIIFLPALLETLSPPSRIALLHSHFRSMIGYWISQGR